MTTQNSIKEEEIVLCSQMYGPVKGTTTSRRSAEIAGRWKERQHPDHRRRRYRKHTLGLSWESLRKRHREVRVHKTNSAGHFSSSISHSEKGGCRHREVSCQKKSHFEWCGRGRFFETRVSGLRLPSNVNRRSTAVSEAIPRRNRSN